jgi:hypothetical protein
LSPSTLAPFPFQPLPPPLKYHHYSCSNPNINAKAAAAAASTASGHSTLTPDQYESLQEQFQIFLQKVTKMPAPEKRNICTLDAIMKAQESEILELRLILSKREQEWRLYIDKMISNAGVLPALDKRVELLHGMKKKVEKKMKKVIKKVERCQTQKATAAKEGDVASGNLGVVHALNREIKKKEGKVSRFNKEMIELEKSVVFLNDFVLELESENVELEKDISERFPSVSDSAATTTHSAATSRN